MEKYFTCESIRPLKNKLSKDEIKPYFRKIQGINS